MTDPAAPPILETMLHSLNVRAEPSIQGAIVGTLRRRQRVEHLGTSPDGYWLRVRRRADGLSGWAAHKYLVRVVDEDGDGEEDVPWLRIAFGEMGTREVPGTGDCPRVLAYLRSTTVRRPSGLHDEIHWCSAFVNWCMEQAGYAGTDSTWSRTWLDWGEAVEPPRRGAIVVFDRPCTRGDMERRCGHAAFLLALEDDGKHVRVLGGNQDDEVNVAVMSAEHVLGYRMPSGF